MSPTTGTDILLIKPGSQKLLYGELSDDHLTAVEPPFWAALVAAWLREKGYGATILDAEAEGMTPRQAAEAARAMRPLLTAVVVSGTNPSASTMNMSGAGEIVRHLRDTAPDLKSLLMGLHPSALPEKTLRAEAADFVCRGEGFFTLPPLLDALKAGASRLDIPGLWHHRDGKIISGAVPPLINDLDRLPMPAWDLLPMEKYRAHNWHCFGDIGHRAPYAVLYTSLGCPFQCAFCCINTLFGRRGIRYRSIDPILRELDYLVMVHGVRHIKIMDEMFALKEDRLLALCRAIAKRNYRVNMWAYARVNTVTSSMLAAMKQAGINWLAYGFESGSRRVLNGVSKGFGPDDALEAADITASHGIHVCANYIFGLPDDDYDTMQETLALMTAMNAPWANIYSAMAYPGSRLYKTARAQGWPLPESWQGYSQYGYESLPLRTRHLTGGEVLAFRDYAFDVYYRNPRYLSMIRRTFGEKTLTHVIEMSRRRLERKHARIG